MCRAAPPSPLAPNPHQFRRQWGANSAWQNFLAFGERGRKSFSPHVFFFPQRLELNGELN